MFERIFVHALRSDSQEGQNLTDRFFYATQRDTFRAQTAKRNSRDADRMTNSSG